MDASDVVQEALLTASKRLAEYLKNPAIPFHAWLRQLARDRLADAYRRELADKRDVAREQAMPAGDRSSLDPAALFADHELTPAAMLMRKEFAERFQQAVDQLEDDGFVVSTDDILDMEYVEHVPDSLNANVAVISSIPSFYGRLYHLFRSVFPCRQYMIHQYSIAQPGQVYFYYPFRIAKGAVKAAKFLYQLPSFLRKK